MQFIDRLRYRAYDSLDITNYTPDLQGWMDEAFAAVFVNCIMNRDRNEPLTIIEVGTWKGLSCSTMAKIVKELGFRNVRIIAIDTWLGAPEFWTSGIDDSTRGGGLKLKDGYPNVFYTFTKNMKSLGHHDIVAPFPISSQQAMDILNYYNIKADVIYIDASHEYKPVKDDMDQYWTLLKTGGSMIGDDYNMNWPGVIKAVNEFSTQTKGSVTGIVWRFDK
jgi:hypothetical protein